MQLENYINDLLYRYDCVIIPNFGGFVTNKIGTTISSCGQVFYPPAKQIGFNANLNHNDGLLANYIASSENISFDEASQKITNLVANWQEELKTSSVVIKAIGSLRLNDENKLIFNPNSTNFLTDSFGLKSVECELVNKVEEKVKPLVPVQKTTTKKGVATFMKYAATIAVLLTLGVIGFQNMNNTDALLVEKEEKVTQKIQEATFVIDTPLPTINLSVEKNTSKKLHIIVGAFEFPENAEKKKAELQAKGFKAKVLKKNKWGLIPVSCGGFNKKTEARKTLYKARNYGYEDAWIFVNNSK